MRIASPIERVQTGLTVAALSVLLWAWADRQLRTAAEVELSVSIRSGRGGAVSPDAVNVRLRLEGPQQAVNELRAAAATGDLRLTYTVPADVPGDVHAIDLLDWLQRQDQFGFRERGIDLLLVFPETRQVELDRDYELPVVVQDRDGRPVDDVVLTVAPARVHARMLRRTYEALAEKSVPAVVDRSALTVGGLGGLGGVSGGMGDGRPVEIEAPLAPPAGVRPDVRTVRVTASLKTKTRTLEGLPIQLAVADPTYWRDYVPEIDARDLRVRVTVSGPAEQVDALRPEDVLAFIAVGKSNTEEPPLDSEVQFRLPRGLEVVRSTMPESRSPDPPRVKCQLKRRPTPPPTPPPPAP
jgi:hypothetical protein